MITGSTFEVLTMATGDLRGVEASATDTAARVTTAGVRKSQSEVEVPENCRSVRIVDSGAGGVAGETME